MLIKSVNSACHPYTYVISSYSEKPQDGNSEFYHPGTENVTKYLINWVDKKQLLEGQNISFDHVYMSFALATWFFTEKHVRYLYWYRKDLPKHIKKLDKSGNLSIEFNWDCTNDIILGSYILSSSKKQKMNVMILATYRPFLGTKTDNGNNKAMLYKFTTSQRMGPILLTSGWAYSL